MQQIQDPVFGLLTRDIIWEGSTSLPQLGDAHLQISTLGSRQPEDWQRKAFESLIQKIDPQTVIDLRRLVYGYFLNLRKQGLLEDEDEPGPNSESDVSLKETTVFVPPVAGKKFNLVLQWEYDWAVEHGVQVLFQNGDAVGTAAIGNDEVED
jgi:hypothetical protein